MTQQLPEEQQPPQTSALETASGAIKDDSEKDDRGNSGWTAGGQRVDSGWTAGGHRMDIGWTAGGCTSLLGDLPIAIFASANVRAWVAAAAERRSRYALPTMVTSLY